MPFAVLSQDGDEGPSVPAMGFRPVNPLGLAMLADLPPIIQDDPLTVAVIHAYSQESQRILDLMDVLVDQWFPQLATELGLPLWEARIGSTISPSGGTVQARRDLVLAALARLRLAPSVVEYQRLLTQIVGAGFVYREFNPLQPDAPPPPNTLFVVLPFEAGSEVFLTANRLMRLFTPVWIDLEISSASGFKLDESGLDADSFS